MRKTIFATILMWMMPISLMFGQTYDALWRQVKEAQEKDLPQTEQQVLGRIVQKAGREKAYGQLLKAELGKARAAALVSADSLQPAVERLEQRCKTLAASGTATVDQACLLAVYNVVLGRIYSDNLQLADDAADRSAQYYKEAMSHPEQLAQVKATAYKPLVVEGTDSRYFGDDLLSLVASETGLYEPAHSYYMTTGNRPAQLFTALEKLRREGLSSADYLLALDSLIERYADLTEAGEAAIVRYQHTTTESVADRVAYIDMDLNRWGSWKRMNELRNARLMLTQRQFNAEIAQQVFIPQKEQSMLLHRLRGVSKLTLRIYRAKVDGDTQLRADAEADYKKLKPLLTELPELKQERHYGPHADYELFDDSLQLPALPVGVYLIELSTSPGTAVSRQLYFVSDVRLLSQSLPDGRLRLVAVNATTGQPLKGARVRVSTEVYRGTPAKMVTLTANAQGECLYDTKQQRNNLRLYAFAADDRACPPFSQWGTVYSQRNQQLQEQCAVYTDRAIYRPGHTVHVGAILYQVEEGYRHQAVPERTLTITLRDANWQEVATKKVTTDRFGTVSADFVLPQQGLSGQYSVRVDRYSSYFSVEEYKRPTFQVEFEKVERDYAAGDTVTVKATARSYAGVPVMGSRVNYRVVRRRALWWMSYAYGGGHADVEVAQGETQTGSDGTFSVDMPLTVPETPYPMFYQFVVTADVTDAAGETHQAQYTLPLGNRKTALSTSLPAKVQREQLPSFMIHLRNAAGNDFAATVSYQIEGPLSTTGKTKDSWQTVAANTAVELPKLKSGSYVLKAVWGGDTLRHEFVVFSESDKRPALQTDSWFWASASQFPNDGKPVTVQVGSSTKDVHIIYTIVDGTGKVVESGAADKSGELINRQLTYRDDYQNGLTLSFAWVKDGKTYQHTHRVQRPLPDKQLRMKWDTFRDRLTPGQQETWTLSVVGPDGKPADAQLMATLYDKSLDQLSSHEWSLQPLVYLPQPTLGWSHQQGNTVYLSGQHPLTLSQVGQLQFSTLDHEWFPTPWLIGRRQYMTRNSGAVPMMAMAKQTMSARMDMNDMAVTTEDADVALGSAEMEGQAAPDVLVGQAPQEVSLREQLQETAFFYPQLRTDASGRVVLQFTLPESLTTWRFLGVAHTEDMMYGELTGETVARKDMMIQPNMPRFLRVGDQATLSARIFNTGGQTVSGTARLVLVDPATETEVARCEQQVTVQADSTVSVTFSCRPEDSWNQLLVAQWSVSGQDFSDGEQHYLPILPDRERVTVTVPFTQHEPGTKTVDLTQLLGADARQATLTVEYTNHPAWLMIQALPTIGQARDDNAVSQAAMLYTNLLGRHLIGQNPQVKAVFEQWRREQGTETSLQSNLQKDQELKDLLLNETPWVMEAQMESEQKQLLVGFFDENQLRQRIAQATEQLHKLQHSDGSWGWWQGMRGSTAMTVVISEMLVRLNTMAGHQSETEQLLNRAFSFVGKEMVELVDEMKKQEKRGVRPSFPGPCALEWLYTCVLDGRTLPQDVQRANTYLKTLLKKELKSQSIYAKALSAIVLNDPLYVKSLKEWTVYREEMGRYYDTQRAGYTWRDYRIPTQVAAMEALQRLTPDDQTTVEEMQRWLLQEKRTTCWDTPLNSVDAIYAFFLPSPDRAREAVSAKLGAGPTARALTVLKVDGKAIETPQATAGMGYVKATVPAAHARTFTAEKTSEGTSWGAVYVQSMQQTADISDQASGLSVKRELLAPASGSMRSALRVGDRVRVRITIVADRDYDFVQVVDKRAACLEPVRPLSGYRDGCYCTPKDYTTNYYFDMLPKGKRVIETEYYIDRAGQYETGTCTVSCAYSPEYRGTTHSQTIIIDQ